jgi:hypothetical protein
MLGKLAAAGDSFHAGRALWTVEKVKGRRIETVRLKSDQPWPAEVLEDAGVGGGSESDAVRKVSDLTLEEPTGHVS